MCWRIEWTNDRKQVARLNHLKGARLIFDWESVVRKRSLLCDRYMLARNQKYTMRQVDAFNVP